MTAKEWSLEQAFQRALRAVILADAPRVVFEDDIVFTSSRPAVAKRIAQILARGNDMGQLGACGRFTCAHATLWTPAGARRMLADVE